MRQTVGVLLLLSALGAHETRACAPAPRDGDQVTVVAESAVIVWDPATRTEHFIRRATFHGGGRDFGFLVPTPTVPMLAEVDDRIFFDLEEHTRPEKVTVTRKEIDWTPFLLRRYEKANTDMTTGAANAVEVLATQKVAGYDAAVLDAKDAEALRKWLSEHGYAMTVDLAEWLDVYVRQCWKITAFKVDATQPQASTSAVKMSFPTDRPFFPYREPASQRNDPKAMNVRRYLHVWYLGPERVSGTVGDANPWQAELRRSDALPDALRTEVAQLASVTLPPSIRMSAFEDTASPRPGVDDLFFAASSDQATVVPPPNVIETVDATWIPLDLVAAVIAIVVIAFFVRRKRRTKHEY